MKTNNLAVFKYGAIVSYLSIRVCFQWSVQIAWRVLEPKQNIYRSLDVVSTLQMTSGLPFESTMQTLGFELLMNVSVFIWRISFSIHSATIKRNTFKDKHILTKDSFKKWNEIALYIFPCSLKTNVKFLLTCLMFSFFQKSTGMKLNNIRFNAGQFKHWPCFAISVLEKPILNRGISLYLNPVPQ